MCRGRLGGPGTDLEHIGTDVAQVDGGRRIVRHEGCRTTIVRKGIVGKGIGVVACINAHFVHVECCCVFDRLLLALLTSFRGSPVAPGRVEDVPIV